MKTLARRGFLQQLGGFVGLVPSASGIYGPVVPKGHKRRISQRDLEDAAVQHAVWLSDDSRGARAVFSDCDLSGLDFLSHEPGIIDLRGSDFTAADLSGTTANQVSFHRASLQSARLSWSQLKLPIFCGATLRRALCNDVVWGWPSPFVLIPPPSIDGWQPRATFVNTDLSFSNFDSARVMGYFSGIMFSSASLRNTDLSHSNFAGIKYICENSFAGSYLTRTKFHYASIDGTNFRFAHLDEPDFSFTKIGSKCSWPGGATL
ncbi:pentapeptide repeat-containing protein [Bradyrhizobium sp. 482_C4_N1_1]|uniref:pentapeptide repeat-containing protein n=1 Tax=unclassified Bradyrhizobium TaxID=2631580 RepID=UPI003F8A117E